MMGSSLTNADNTKTNSYFAAQCGSYHNHFYPAKDSPDVCVTNVVTNAENGHLTEIIVQGSSIQFVVSNVNIECYFQPNTNVTSFSNMLIEYTQTNQIPDIRPLEAKLNALEHEFNVTQQWAIVSLTICSSLYFCLALDVFHKIKSTETSNRLKK